MQLINCQLLNLSLKFLIIKIYQQNILKESIRNTLLFQALEAFSESVVPKWCYFPLKCFFRTQEIFFKYTAYTR